LFPVIHAFLAFCDGTVKNKGQFPCLWYSEGEILLERTCVKVPKENGEAVRRFLLKENLLDLNLLIEREGEFLYLPTHPLPVEVIKILQEKFRALIEIHRFTKVRQRPKTLHELLEEILPGEDLTNAPQGFDRIGDIVIVEIKESLKQFESEIGAAILAAHPSVTTIYIKDSKVHGSRRLQKLRCIAGQEKTRTIHREYGVCLCVSIGKVYFSPRLAQEHVRVATQVTPNERVLDMFTGVGPFPIHIATRVAGEIYAIDINPDAIVCLKESMQLNKLRGTIISLLGDARAIIHKQLQGSCDRVIMNLPRDAVTYIPAAVSAVKTSGGIIHFYTVEKEPASEETAKSTLCEKVNATAAGIQILRSRRIKEIAPRMTQVVVDAFIQPKQS